MDSEQNVEHAGLASLAAHTSSRDAPLWGTFLALGLSFLYYFATSSAAGYWLDAGEFVAAARTLGITHPPGQPLSALFHGVFALLPFGPLSFRVAVASAAACAVAVAFAFRCVHHCLTISGFLPPVPRALLALAAALSLAAGSGVWLQAVRPEVYALQAALSFIALDGLLRYERDAAEGNWPALYVAALAEGLSLANHHFLGLLLLPAAAPTVGRAVARHGFGPLRPAAGLLLLALSTYAYLPLRAHADPIPNLGAPTSLARLYWVLSAQAFQQTYALPDHSFAERLIDVAVLVVDTVSWPVLLFGLAGLYLGFRVARLRRLAAMWSLVLVSSVCGRAFLGFVRDNPDAMGYLLPAYLAVVVLAALFLAALLRAVLGRGRSVWIACGLLCALVWWKVDRAAQTFDRSRFADTALFERLALRDLPYGAVVLLHEPQSIFRSIGARVERAERPDIQLVPVPLLSYPGMVECILERTPAVRGLVRSYLLEEELQASELQSLAAERPLYVELDPRLDPSLYQTLIPEGLLYRVLADGTTERDEQRGQRTQQEAFAALYAGLPVDALDPRTGERLLWMHYLDALYYAGFGDREAATRSLAHALAQAPRARELLALRRALDTPDQGPLDVRPFLPGSSPGESAGHDGARLSPKESL